MRYCPRCGAEVDDDTRYCPACSYNFDDYYYDQDKKRMEEAKKSIKNSQPNNPFSDFTSPTKDTYKHPDVNESKGIRGLFDKWFK